MEFPCHIEQRPAGDWLIRYAGSTVGAVDVTAPTRQAALEKMHKELQFRLELCPCTGEMAPQVEILLRERT
ncbi:MAG: hypothetical protein ACT4QC_12960 [Planctomycetaceae bacterium]